VLAEAGLDAEGQYRAVRRYLDARAGPTDGGGGRSRHFV